MVKTDSLNVKQRRAIRSLLTKPTIEAAAKAAEVSESALYRWLREDDFRAALTAAESDAIDAAARRLVSLAEKSLNTVEAIIDDASLHPATRLRAAEIVFSNMLRFVELRSVEQRLADLEAKVNAQPR